MRMPGFTAEATLYRSNRQYIAASTDIVTRDQSVVRPQFCGPCENGRRQCGDYGWTCYPDTESPECNFLTGCPIICHQGGFRTWSIPCGQPPIPLPFGSDLAGE